MAINRAVRTASAVVLAILVAFVGISPRHMTPGNVQAEDTTWRVPVRDGGASGGVERSDDTTW